MYYALGLGIYGYCRALDYQEELQDADLLISEDLRDALPFLYKKHFGVEYKELGWWLIPGAREWVKEMEDKWFHNQLDLHDLYKDPEFLEELRTAIYSLNYDEIEDMVSDFEMSLEGELNSMDSDEIKELYDEEGPTIDYDIVTEDDEVIYCGSVWLPDLEEEDE